jgi:hypothetical protein
MEILSLGNDSSMKISLYFLFLSALIGGGTFFGFSNFSVAEKDFSFSVGECTKDANPHSGSRAGIVSQKFNEEGDFIVDGFIKGICSEDDIIGDIKINEQDIFLLYSIKKRNDSSQLYANSIVNREEYRKTCSCSQRVQYRIQNVEQKQYSLSIQKK